MAGVTGSECIYLPMGALDPLVIEYHPLAFACRVLMTPSSGTASPPIDTSLPP